MEAPLALRILAVLFLVGANAFFVAAEFVLVSVRSTRLRQLQGEGYTTAGIALRLQGHIDRVLSGTQLGITLASLGLGWVGEDTVAQSLLPAVTPFFPAAGAAIAHTIAIVVAFLIITAMHLVLGEVVPKNVALGSSADRLALLIARPMDWFLQVTHPFLRVMDVAAAGISRLFGAESASHRHLHSPEELKMLVTAGREGGVLEEHLESMIHGIFDLNQTLVREVMVPRPDIVSVSVDTPLEDVLRSLVESRHSSVPVYEKSPEHFIGILYEKDLFRVWLEMRVAAQTGRAVRGFNLRSLVREALIVPETKPLDQLLLEFQQRRRQLALVVDEFGSIAGLVSAEDVLERIVGELADEHDVEEPAPATGTGLALEGATHIHDLEERYEIRLPRDRGFETLAGFLMSRLGRIPKPGDRLVFNGWRYTVASMDRHRIDTVRLDRVQPQPQAEATGSAPRSARG